MGHGNVRTCPSIDLHTCYWSLDCCVILDEGVCSGGVGGDDVMGVCEEE